MRIKIRNRIRIVGLAASLVMAKSPLAMGLFPKNEGNLLPAQKRFTGMNFALVVDAIEGAEMLGTEFYADGERDPFYRSSVTMRGNREIMPLPTKHIPVEVRVVWHDSSKLVGRADDMAKSTYAGKVIGDYKIKVAERIPNEVLAEIKKNGGGLRLKFRLKEDGVLFGWDIVRSGGSLSRYFMPGGDFLETRY
jgi:hypothetical protein